MIIVIYFYHCYIIDSKYVNIIIITFKISSSNKNLNHIIADGDKSVKNMFNDKE
jgi:hypothetical protein